MAGTSGESMTPFHFRETLTFDGWELTEGTVRDWEVRDGMDSVAGFVGDNHTVANRGGEIWRPKVHGPGRFTVALWLLETDAAGVQAAWRTLLRAMAKPRKRIRVERTMANTEAVFCDAEVVGGIEPTHLGQQGYRASVTFNVPEGIWLSAASYSHTTPAGSSLPKTLTLTDLADSTAPHELLKYVITGPITNPKLTDVTGGSTGDSLTYAGTVPSGQSLTINASNWSTTGSTFSVNNGLLVPTGNRLMTVQAAGATGSPEVKLEGTGGGTGTKLYVEGRRVYLC